MPKSRLSKPGETLDYLIYWDTTIQDEQKLIEDEIIKDNYIKEIYLRLSDNMKASFHVAPR